MISRAAGSSWQQKCIQSRSNNHHSSTRTHRGRAASLRSIRPTTKHPRIETIRLNLADISQPAPERGPPPPSGGGAGAAEVWRDHSPAAGPQLRAAPPALAQLLLQALKFELWTDWRSWQTSMVNHQEGSKVAVLAQPSSADVTPAGPGPGPPVSRYASAPCQNFGSSLMVKFVGFFFCSQQTSNHNKSMRRCT